MIPPRENYIAAYPPGATAGNVKLHALTLGGAVRLGAEGIDCGARVPEDRVFQAAFVLAGDTDYRLFLRRAKCGLKELSEAVEAVLNTAFSTYIKPAKPKDGGGVKHLTPHGLGWPLEWAEWLCAEYGWSWREALDTPVATVYALAAASRQRHGGRHAGLDYVERGVKRGGARFSGLTT